MGDIPQLIKIGVSLKIQPNNGPVFFKVDGQRFGQNRTIKLLTGSKYNIEVVVKPGAITALAAVKAKKLLGCSERVCRLGLYSQRFNSYLFIGLHKDEYTRKPWAGGRVTALPLRQAKKTGGRWRGGGKLTRSGEFNEVGTFETVWQVKYYNYHKRDHCQWGNSFSSIEYECKPNETRSLMWINKEMFH
ncbi:CNRP1 protein, partial [Polyodon spathula]|nr:CNRP1 protein [Polyodon spathula]